MESEGESIPLHDIETVQGNVVLRRHKICTSMTRRNVAIIDGTLISSGRNFQTDTLLNSEQQGENYYHVHELGLDVDNYGRTVQVSS